jgi:hypothetical protein
MLGMLARTSEADPTTAPLALKFAGCLDGENACPAEDAAA